MVRPAYAPSTDEADLHVRAGAGGKYIESSHRLVTLQAINFANFVNLACRAACDSRSRCGRARVGAGVGVGVRMKLRARAHARSSLLTCVCVCARGGVRGGGGRIGFR